MTFKDLQKVVESQPDYHSSQQSEMLDKLRGKSFYYWDDSKHNGASKSKSKSKSKSRKNKNDCCFNHIIGLPTKDGNEKPLFDYEREIYFAVLKPGYLPFFQHNFKSFVILFLPTLGASAWYYPYVRKYVMSSIIKSRFIRRGRSRNQYQR